MPRQEQDHRYWPFLYDLTELFGSRSFDLEGTARTVLSVGMKIAEADAGALAVLDKKGRIRYRAVEGLEEEATREGGLLDRVIEACGEAEGAVSDPDLSAERGRAALILPLRASLRPQARPAGAERRRFPVTRIQKLLGVLYLERARGPVATDRTEILSDYVAHAAAVLIRAELYDLATVDPLTGCYSRKEFEHNLEAEMTIAEHTDTPLAVVLLDIEGFSELCYRFGYRWGEALLERVAHQIRTSLRETDIPFRYGGGKFVLVMPYTDAEGARVAAAKIAQGVAASETEFPVTVTAGIAVYPHHANRKEELVRKADQALYLAQEGQGEKIRTWHRGIPRYALRTDKLIGIITGDEGRDYRNVSMLLDTIVVVNAIREREQMLSTVLDMMVDLTGADRAVLFVRHGEDLAIELAQDAHKRRLELDPAPFTPVVERVERTGFPVFILGRDGEGDGELEELARLRGLEMLIAVPLVVKDRPSGIIYLDRKGPGREVIESDLIFLQAVAREIGIAVENARLYEENLRSRRKVEKLAAQLARKVEAQKDELERARVAVRQAEDALETKYNYDRIIGRSPPMRELYRLLDKVTDTSIPVLIQGESGTGKELVARCIHFNGPRKQKPFVSVNCAAIAESLLETELFGHVKGAFTGADRNKKGLFEQAHGGTIFLDEIQDMSPGMQRELLRVLQEGEIRPVGGKDVRKVDVRVISATNADIRTLVREGRFREDLYYRLNVVTLKLPPLRERQVDIPLLVERYLEELSEREGRPIGIEKEALRLLMQHPWPGNVRQLFNVLERGALLAEGGRITAADLNLDPPSSPPSPEGMFFTLPYKVAKEKYLEAYVRNALERAGGNVTRAAREAEIVRSSFHKIMRKYGITAREYGGA